MVATLVRLKARILAHTLGREGWRVVILVFGIIWALSTLPSVVGAMVWLGRQPVDVGHDVLVIAGSVILVGWGLVPVLVPSIDDSLDIGRFATYGIPVRRLLPGLLLATLLGLPTMFTGLVTLAPVIAWSAIAGPAAGWTAVLMAPITLASCVVLSRVSTGVAARFLGSRRSREVGAVLGVLVLGLCVPAVVTLGALGLEGALERVPALARVLGWTPLGLTWAAPAAIASGDVLGGVARALLALVWLAAGIVVWAILLRRALVRPPSRGGEVRRRPDAMLPARDNGSSAGLIAAEAVLRRSLRYWSSDPRYLSSLLGAVVLPLAIVLLVATVIDAPAAVALSMGPLMAGTIGWGRHNDLAFDGSAFWMHVTAGVPGWADRLGRTLATLAWSAPLTVVVALGGAWAGGRWDLAHAALGASLGVLGAGLAVSAVANPVLPYPVPEAGSNPYAAQIGVLGVSMLAQLVSSAATLVVIAPVLVLYGLTLWGSMSPWVVLVVGVAWGAGALVLGVRLGGRVYDLRSRRVLARLT